VLLPVLLIAAIAGMAIVLLTLRLQLPPKRPAPDPLKPTRPKPDGSEDPLLTKILEMDDIPFESPTRGAIVVMNLSRGPPSERLPELSPAEYARDAVRRTIRHSHLRRRVVAQCGTGSTYLFQRHVTEGSERWNFEVEVAAGDDGTPWIESARMKYRSRGVESQGEAGVDEDAQDSWDEEIDAHPSGAPPIGMLACPCCGHATVTSRGAYEICPVCFWEDDGQGDADADAIRGGPNRVSLVDGRRNFARIGASDEEDLGKVREPTAEEGRCR